MHAIKRQPPHVHDLVVAIDRLPTGRRLAIQIRYAVIAFLLNLHEPSMQRVQLFKEPACIADLELVGVAVEPKMQTQLLYPLVSCLPRIRTLCQHPIQRVGCGPLDLVVVDPSIQVKRQASHSLSHNPGARHPYAGLHRQLGRDSLAVMASDCYQVVPAAKPRLEPFDFGRCGLSAHCSPKGYLWHLGRLHLLTHVNAARHR